MIKKEVRREDGGGLNMRDSKEAYKYRLNIYILYKRLSGQRNPGSEATNEAASESRLHEI